MGFNRTLLLLPFLLVACGKSPAPGTQETMIEYSQPPGAHRTLSALAVTGGESAPYVCEGKARCLVVYKAPWCPVCKASIPLFQKIRRIIDSEPDVGLVLVLSPAGGQWDGHEAMAQEMGGVVHLDPHDSVWTPELQSRAGGVPAWAVYDEAGNLVSLMAGGSREYDDETVRVVLYDQLKLNDYINF